MTYPLGKDTLEGKPCETCSDYATNCAVGCTREGDGHDSDCATHNDPAYPNGSCDCSFINIEPDAWASKIMCIGPDYGKISGCSEVFAILTGQ